MFCAESHFLVPQGHPLPAPCSALRFSGNRLASFILQIDTGLQLCVSLLSPPTCWCENQGMPRTSLPAGMVASMSLQNSKQDMCSHHTGTDAPSWVQENTVKSPCCEAHCITRLHLPPLERDLFFTLCKQIEWRRVF